MPGRQAHGRPLLAASGPKQGKSHAKPFKRSRAKAASKALDAFAIAAEEIGPDRPMRSVRMRAIEERPKSQQHKGKRGHDDDDDEGDFGEDDEEEAPQKKRAKRDNEDDFDGFSGSSGSEEWHVGVGDGDEDSELDSDEAFGESDEEKFEGFAFGGSSSMKKPNKKKKTAGDDEEKEEGKEDDDDDVEEEEDEEDEEEDDLESLGSDAIDLATALDQYSESEEGEEREEGEEEDEESDEVSTDGDDESDESDEEDLEKLDALQKMIAGFAGEDSDNEDGVKASSGKAKLSLKDLGLAGVKDPHIKKSLKLMNKEEKAAKPGAGQKLTVPLAKRQEDRILRAAAYEKTTETLNRWIDTVKHNRRADHLMFPLAQNAHDKGLDSGELQPVTQKTAGTELESTILAIMEESGLGPTVNKTQKETGGLEGHNQLSTAEQKEIARQRRRERELHSREMARAKRIKKIKSKAYRRIHRKELLKEQQAAHEAALENGEIDSEEDREAMDRRRALERMGARHRESKWAKLGKKAGRAVWDEDFRASLTDMARRKEELRRRIEGRRDGSDDDDGSDVSMDDVDDKRQLLAELDRAAAYSDDDEPKSALMQMKFMQRGEELRRKENDELIAQLRHEMDSDDEGGSADEMDIGRRQYGMGKPALKLPGDQKKAKKTAADAASEPVIFKESLSRSEQAPQVESFVHVASAPGAAGAWSRVGEEGRKSRKAASKGNGNAIDLSNSVATASKSSKPKPKTQPQTRTAGKGGNDAGDDSDDSDAIHLPMAIRDQELIKRAFAGEDVAGEFHHEKAEVEQEDDDKEIDNTLPGWGGWVGEGVSAREQKRHKGRFVTKVEGIKKKDRKDYKLKDVIISERRVKKNDKYLATQLPHPFESHQQYERSMRMPVGPEWSTKEVFQSATKPRLIIKQGIIAPMSKPMV